MNEDVKASKYASNNLKTQEQIKDSIKYFVKKNCENHKHKPKLKLLSFQCMEFLIDNHFDFNWVKHHELSGQAAHERSSQAVQKLSGQAVHEHSG